MEEMVEENGGHLDADPLKPSSNASKSSSNSIAAVTCVQSVIQPPTQLSVIQSATTNSTNMQQQQQPTVLTKGNVILVSKPNSVIQTAQGSLQTLQVVVDARASDDDRSISPQPKKRRQILSESPSRRKLETTTSTGDIFTKLESSGSEDCDSNLDSELSSHSLSVTGGHYQTVLSNDTLHLATAAAAAAGHTTDDLHHLPTITMTTSGTTTGGTILHYAGQDGQFFVPGEIVVMQSSNEETSSSPAAVPEVTKKREIRLLKNREAARECRRKKKEYIKCLENRVAVLEAQNKALIDELKTLKELYCSQKTEQ